MIIVADGVTDAGRDRDHNEDALLIDDELGIYIVCDGMGGHEAGEVASSLAAARVREFLEVFREDLTEFRDGPSARLQLERLVSRAIMEASQAVCAAANETPERSGMGTTLTMALVRDGVAVIGHVGDSRAYLMRDGELHQLTDDHTYIADLVRSGMPVEKARHSTFAHVLTRAVGRGEALEVDTRLVELIAGDRLLLCSDGLVGHVDTPAGLGPRVAAGASAAELVEFGNEHIGTDNVTALVLDVRVDEAHPDLDRKRDDRITLKLGLVGSVWLFESLNLAQIGWVTSRMSEVEVDTGAVIMREGESGDQMFLVIDGEVEVSRHGQRLALLGPGQHVGEIALLSGKARNATVKATRPTELLAITRDAFRNMIEAQPRLGLDLLWTMAGCMVERIDV